MRFKWLGATVLALALFGCGGGGGGSTGTSSVFYINSVPDSTDLVFALTGTQAGTPLTYGSTSNGFLNTPSGADEMSVQEQGAAPPQLWNELDTLQPSTAYLDIALGEENYGTETLKRVQELVTPVNATAPTGNKATLIIVHALEEAAGIPTPNIDFANPGNNPTFSSLNISPATSAVLTVNSGAQSFEARQNGTTGYYVSQNFTLAAGGVYVMLVTGINGQTGAEAPVIKQIQIPTQQ